MNFWLRYTGQAHWTIIRTPVPNAKDGGISFANVARFFEECGRRSVRIFSRHSDAPF